MDTVVPRLPGCRLVESQSQRVLGEEVFPEHLCWALLCLLIALSGYKLNYE